MGPKIKRSREINYRKGKIDASQWRKVMGLVRYSKIARLPRKVKPMKVGGAKLRA